MDNCTETEMVKCFSVIKRDVGWGGSNDRISLHWSKKHEGFYDEANNKAITWSHWKQMKAELKLSNNSDHPKKGDDGYNPSNKFDFILKVILNNTN